MKKMLYLLLFLGALPAFSQPVPVSETAASPLRIEPFDANGFGYAEKIYDRTLTNSGTTNDTIIGNVFDIRKLALVRHYDLDSVAIQARMDSLVGQVTASCYDALDSNGVTDSVNTRFTVQGSDFASNNSDPNTPASDAWYTLKQFTVNDVSASSAQVTVDTLKVNIPVTTHSTQFIRVYGENLSTAAQNDTRCRLFLYRPRWIAN